MGESIQRGVSKIKGFLKVFMTEDILLSLIIIFVATGSFGLGRLSLSGVEKDPVLISNSREVTQLAGVVSSGITKQQNIQNASYVASAQGTKYYLVTCASAERIKEENKIFFESKEEAERAGYEKALNCPGL